MWNVKTGKYVKCSHCGKKIYVTAANLKKHKNHFCNLKCCHDFQKQPMKYKIIDDYALFYAFDEFGEQHECIIDADNVGLLDHSWKVYHMRNYLCLMDYHLIKMHRLIINCPDNFVIDHINTNSLDNRRCNLRIITQAQNLQNLKAFNCNSHTGVRNVYIRKDRNKYFVKVVANKKTYTKGYYPMTEEGLLAAIQDAKEMRSKYLPYSTF